MARRASTSTSRARKARAKPRKAAAGKRTAPRKAAPRKVAAGKTAARKTAPRKAAGARASAPTGKSAAPRKAAAGRKAAAVRKAPVKATAPKRAAAGRAAPKRAPSRAAPRKPVPPRRTTTARAPRTSPRLQTAAPAQRFTVTHLREEDFRANGLRPYAHYRDLGIAAATGGLAQAHVIRMIPPVTDEVRQRHFHNVELQLVYVLKGWMKNEFEGHGVQMMEQGTCWLQPPGIRHTVLDYSDDLEVLEIIIPAEFETHAAD
jgi:hypothetical protein